MRLNYLGLFIFGVLFASLEVGSQDTKLQGYERSCHEFKELMTSGNKLMFLRSDVARNNSTWQAVMCLQCSRSKQSDLIRVTSLENKSTSWRYPEKNFLLLDEIISNDDDQINEILGMHSILTSVRKTCKAYLEPINEGSHLELSGREQCVRHEYLRLYLKRKYSLNESHYLDLELKKDLAPDEFIQSCRHFMKEASERSVLSKGLATIIVSVKNFLGIGLGEYDPVVSRDSKSYYREIANDQTSKPLK